MEDIFEFFFMIVVAAFIGVVAIIDHQKKQRNQNQYMSNNVYQQPPQYQQPYPPQGYMPQPQMPMQGPCCARCHSNNITFMPQYIGGVTRSTGEVRRKSAVVRHMNKKGRQAANMMTMGMYGMFVPKRSEYKEVTRANTTNKTIMMGICQSCGYSWRA